MIKRLSCFLMMMFYLFAFTATSFANEPTSSNNTVTDQLKEQIEEYYKSGIACYKNGNYSSAISYLLKVEEYYHNNKNVYIALGESHRQLKNYSSSIQYLAKAYSLGARDYTTLTGLGYSYMDNNNYSQAYPYLLEAMNQFPSNPDPPWNIGIVCDKLGKESCTLSAMKKVIEISPSYGVDPYLYVGFIYSNNKKYDYSLKYYIKGLEYFPQNALLYYYAGDIYYATGYYEDAANYLENAVKYDTSFLDAFYLLGMSYIQVDNLDYATDECSYMQKLNSNAISTKNLCNAVNQKKMEKQMQQQMIQDQIQQDIQTQQDIQDQQSSMINV